MLPAQRRQLILETIRDARGAGVVELAERFSVSEMTVRRDLGRLAEEVKLTRGHRGSRGARGESPFAKIATERSEEKERIGRAAASLVHDGQTIMVDIGTTTLE